MIPPGKLTIAERRALDPSAPQHSDGACDAIRPWLVNLPGFAVGKIGLVHTFPIDGITIRMLARLAAGLDGSPHGPIEVAERQAFRQWLRSDPRGAAILDSTLRRVLCRGYADGSRALLGQIHPDLFKSRATRPVRRFPWVEIRVADKPAARIAWTRQVNV